MSKTVNKINTKRILIFLLFLCYIGLLAYLILFERSVQSYYDYNIVPFRIIKVFYSILTTYPKEYFWYAMENLIGNVVLFIPLGIFLPYLFKDRRNFFAFFLTVVMSISFVEIIQFLTRLGTGDIDDVILNTLGALIGYIIFIIYYYRKKSRKA